MGGLGSGDYAILLWVGEDSGGWKVSACRLIVIRQSL